MLKYVFLILRNPQQIIVVFLTFKLESSMKYAPSYHIRNLTWTICLSYSVSFMLSCF